MRCKFCTLTTFDYSENIELCAIFGYGDDVISENKKRGSILDVAPLQNKKGEIGCPYNMKTLEKIQREYLEFLAKHG